jgi:hypothetical protein
VLEIVREQVDLYGDRLVSEVRGALWEAATGDHVEALGMILKRYPATPEQLNRLLARAFFAAERLR